ATRWGIVILAVISLGAWLLTKPDPAAVRRQQTCKFWGVTDEGVLAKCRQSTEQEAAITEPLKRPIVEHEIEEFNQNLAALTPERTRAKDTGYPAESIEGVAKLTGGSLGFIISKDMAKFPAKGQRVKISGVVVVHDPDPDHGPDEQTEPRYFTIEADTHPQDTMPSTVNLDIESLNRHER